MRSAGVLPATMNVVNVLSESSRKIPVARLRGEPAEDMIRGRFRASSRLLRHADFQSVYKQGRRHFGAHMTVFYLEREHVPPAVLSRGNSEPGGPRIGFTVGRALGGAVQRNRIKRRMREAVRANLQSLSAPVDVVINPKQSALTADLKQLRGEVARAFALIDEKCNKSADQRG